jgi:GlpG protein
MRMIGQLNNESTAGLLGDFLYAQGIKNQIEPETDGSFVVWIYSEDQIEAARHLMDQFLKDPENPTYRQAAGKAAELRSREDEDQEEYEKRVRTPDQIWRGRMARLTLALIVISVAVTFISNFGNDRNMLRGLWISLSATGLPEVRNGEIWRLITPIFIHLHPLHLLFNMLWTLDLGRMVERRHGTLWFALMVVVIAVVSNVGQYMARGPGFGGMSGVVYGLLGYVFIKGKLDPGSGFFLHQTTMVMMMIWFVLGFSGFLNIANTAHALGLGVGLIWGYISSTRK